NAQGGSVVLTLELQIRHSALAPQSRDDPVTDLVQRLQIVTEDLDGHLRRLAAEALADAIAEEGDDLSLDAGIAGEDLAQGPLRLRLIDRGIGLELDVQLAAMCAPGVLTRLRSSDLLLDAGDVRQREDLGADPLPKAQHLIQRGPGNGARGLHHEVAFAKVRHERAAQERHEGAGHQHQHNDDPYRQPDSAVEPLDYLALPR